MRLKAAQPARKETVDAFRKRQVEVERKKDEMQTKYDRVLGRLYRAEFESLALKVQLTVAVEKLRQRQ